MSIKDISYHANAGMATMQWGILYPSYLLELRCFCLDSKV